MSDQLAYALDGGDLEHRGRVTSAAHACGYCLEVWWLSRSSLQVRYLRRLATHSSGSSSRNLIKALFSILKRLFEHPSSTCKLQMSLYTDCKGVPLDNSASISGHAEKDIESNGLIVGRKPGLFGRLNGFCKHFGSGFLVGLLVLAVLASTFFTRPQVHVFNDILTGCLGLIQDDDGNDAMWTFKGWGNDSCDGTPAVNQKGEDPQDCAPTPDGVALTNVTWNPGEGQHYAVCLYSGAGCTEYQAEWISEATCADGHDAISYIIRDSSSNCQGTEDDG